MVWVCPDCETQPLDTVISHFRKIRGEMKARGGGRVGVDGWDWGWGLTPGVPHPPPLPRGHPPWTGPGSHPAPPPAHSPWTWRPPQPAVSTLSSQHSRGRYIIREPRARRSVRAWGGGQALGPAPGTQRTQLRPRDLPWTGRPSLIPKR